LLISRSENADLNMSDTEFLSYSPLFFNNSSASLVALSDSEFNSPIKREIYADTHSKFSRSGASRPKF